MNLKSELDNGNGKCSKIGIDIKNLLNSFDKKKSVSQNNKTKKNQKGFLSNHLKVPEKMKVLRNITNNRNQLLNKEKIPKKNNSNEKKKAIKIINRNQINKRVEKSPIKKSKIKINDKQENIRIEEKKNKSNKNITNCPTHKIEIKLEVQKKKNICKNKKDQNKKKITKKISIQNNKVV